MPHARRQTAELRKGRLSLPGARYFVTACTADRRPIFAAPQIAALASATLFRLVRDGDVEWLAGTVMPDHVHLLFALGARLSLDRTLAKLKGLISRNWNLLESTKVRSTRSTAPAELTEGLTQTGTDQRSGPTAEPFVFWQENVFEHHLPTEEDAEDYAFYTF